MCKAYTHYLLIFAVISKINLVLRPPHSISLVNAYHNLMGILIIPIFKGGKIFSGLSQVIWGKWQNQA